MGAPSRGPAPARRTGWYNAHAKDTMCTFPEVAAFEERPWHELGTARL